jgi:hypothetical protein
MSGHSGGRAPADQPSANNTAAHLRLALTLDGPLRARSTESCARTIGASSGWQIHGSWSKRLPIVSTMRAVLAVVVAVIAVIFVLKVIAAVSALVLAFVPAIIALGGGYAAGQIHGARRERRKLEAKRGGQLPK